MADFNELQARTLLDACLALRRGCAVDRDESFRCMFLTLDDSSESLALGLGFDESDALAAIKVACGPEGARDMQRLAIQSSIPGEIPFHAFATIGVEFEPISFATEEMLEIFRLARAPYPKEAVVPALVAHTAEGKDRPANQAERKLLLRIVVALRESMPRFSELFRCAVGTEPPHRLSISGSPLKPKLEIVVDEAAAWWNALDLREAMTERLAPPRLPVGDGAWRIDVIDLPNPSAHDDSKGNTPSLVVIGEANPPRALGALMAISNDLPPILATLGKLLRELAASGTISTLPKHIECNPLPAEILRRFLAPAELDVSSRPPSEDYLEFLETDFADLMTASSETQQILQMRAPVADFEWFDCELALLERFSHEIETYEERELGELSREFCGDESWLLDSLDHLEATNPLAFWRFAFHPEDDETWCPAPPPHDPTRFEGARRYFAALRAAATRFYRVARVLDSERVELVDLSTGKTCATYSLQHAMDDRVDDLVLGRVLTIGDASLFVGFVPGVEPQLFRSLLEALPDLGIRITRDGILGDERFGNILTWLDSADESAEDPEPYEVEDFLMDGSAEVATTRMIEYVDSSDTTFRGRPLREAAADPESNIEVRCLLRAFPSLIDDDGIQHEPDRGAVAKHLGIDAS